MKKYLKIIIPIVISLIIIGIALGIAYSVNLKKSKTKEYMLKEAKELQLPEVEKTFLYDKNKARAKFNGRVYTVTGYITKINKDRIIIEDNDELTTEVFVHAYFLEENKTKLYKGQKITIVGKIEDFQFLKIKDDSNLLDVKVKKRTNIKMINCHIVNDIYEVNGSVEISNSGYYNIDENGERKLVNKPIKDWYCALNTNYDISEAAEIKNFHTTEDKPSIILGKEIRTGSLLKVKGKIIKEIHVIDEKIFKYKMKFIEIIEE